MASWQTPLCPFSIEFEPEKLDEIRMAVVDGFFAIPRGGVEIGGVLYGKREDGRLLIADYRKIETEYLTGPSFHPSENDRAGLRKLLDETKLNGSGIGPVGWFHSHTRSGIHLSAKDLEFYREFFPEPWQVALVLKPDKAGAVRAGYFFRGADGAIKADGSALEFSVPVYAGERRETAVVPTPEPDTFQLEGGAGDSVSPTRRVTGVFSFPGIRASSWKKRALLILLAMALVASALLGYWVAVR